MLNTNMEAYKITREIKRSGKTYEFYRTVKGEFGEPVDEPSKVGTIACLYHEQSSSISITTGDTTQIRSKKIPSLLCLYTDVKTLQLAVGDFVVLDDKKYNVTGFIDVQLWNIIADISMEVVDDGILI